MSLDASTLFIVAITLTGLLGLFLVFLWIQDRQVRALGWWGAAHLLGGCAVTFWMAHPASLPFVPNELPSSLLFAAAGMIWGGARVFHGKRPLWPAMLAGSVIWFGASQFSFLAQDAAARVVLSSLIVATYTV